MTSRTLLARLTDACGNLVPNGTAYRTRSWWAWAGKWQSTTWNYGRFNIYTANPNGGLGDPTIGAFTRLTKRYTPASLIYCGTSAVELRTDTVGGGRYKYTSLGWGLPNQSSDYTDLLKLPNSATDPNDPRWKAYYSGSLDEVNYIKETERSNLHVTAGVNCGGSWADKDSLGFRVIPDSIDRIVYIDNNNAVIPSLGPYYGPDVPYGPGLDSDLPTKRTERQFRLVVDSTNNCAGAVDLLIVRIFDRYGNPIYIEDTARVYFNKLQHFVNHVAQANNRTWREATAGFIGPTGGVFVPTGSIGLDNTQAVPFGPPLGDEFLNTSSGNNSLNGTLTVQYQTYFANNLSDTTVIEAVAKGSTFYGNTGSISVFIDSGVVRSKQTGPLARFVLKNPNKDEIYRVCERKRFVGDSTMFIFEAQDAAGCRLYWYHDQTLTVQLTETACGSPNSAFGNQAYVVSDTLAWWGWDGCFAIRETSLNPSKPGQERLVAATGCTPMTFAYAYAPDGDGDHRYSGTGLDGLPTGWGWYYDGDGVFHSLYKLFPGTTGLFPLTPSPAAPCAYNLDLPYSFNNYGWGVFDVYPRAPGVYKFTVTDWSRGGITVESPYFSYRPGRIRFVSINTPPDTNVFSLISKRYGAKFPRDGNRSNDLNNPTDYSDTLRYFVSYPYPIDPTIMRKDFFRVDTFYYDSTYTLLLRNWDFFGNRNVCDSIYITLEPKYGPWTLSSLGGTIANVDFLVKDTLSKDANDVWNVGASKLNGSLKDGKPVFAKAFRNELVDPRLDQFTLKYNGMLTLNNSLFRQPWFFYDIAGPISTRDVYVKSHVKPTKPTLVGPAVPAGLPNTYRIDSTKVAATDPFFNAPPMTLSWGGAGRVGKGLDNDLKDTIVYKVKFVFGATTIWRTANKPVTNVYDSVMTMTGDVVASTFGLGPSVPLMVGTWQVLAIAFNGMDSTWSDALPLTLIYNVPPSAFTLATPANGTVQVVDAAYTQALTWNAAADVNGDVVRYRVYVQVVRNYPVGTGQPLGTTRTFDAGTAVTVALTAAQVQDLLLNLTTGADSTTVNWWVVAEDHNNQSVDFQNNPRSDYLTTSAPFALTLTKIGVFGKIKVDPPNYTAAAINATAGDPVPMTLTALDNNGDVFHAFNTSGPASITLLIRNSTATGSPDPLQKLTVYDMSTGSPVALAGNVTSGFTLLRTSFTSGVAPIRVVDTKAENGVRLVIGTSGTTGADSSALMNFAVGPLADFLISVTPVDAPDIVYVFRPFELVVQARDQYHNYITSEVQAQFTARYADEFTTGGGVLFSGMRLMVGRMVYTLTPTTSRNDQSLTVLAWADPSKRGTTAAFRIVNHAPAAFSLIAPRNGGTLTLDTYSQTFPFTWGIASDPYKGWTSSSGTPPVIYPGDVVTYTWRIKEEALIAYPSDSAQLATSKTFTAAELLSIINTLGGSTTTKQYTVNWYVNATDGLFTTPSTQTWLVTIAKGGITAVDNPIPAPTVYALDQNYPNPFNPTTSIHYQLPKTSAVSLVIYNMLGQPIRTLISGQQQEANYYSVTWDGTNDLGQAVSSGMYIYRLQAGDFVATKKMMFLK